MSKEKLLFFKPYDKMSEATYFITWLDSRRSPAWKLNETLAERLLILIKSGELSDKNSREIICKEMHPEVLELLLCDRGLLMMKKGYITAWDIGVYFSHLPKSASLVISERAYKLFENDLVKMTDLYKHNVNKVKLDLFLKEKEKEVEPVQVVRIKNRAVENEIKGEDAQAQYEDVDFKKDLEDLNFRCTLL